MNNYDQKEEKIMLREDVYDEIHSPFYNLRPSEYQSLWALVTQRTDRYARVDGTDDEWLGWEFNENFQHSDHALLGLGLRLISMDRIWANLRNQYRNNEWNRYMVITNNTIIMQLRQYAANKRRTVETLLMTPDVVMMHAVMRNTLVKLFDTSDPEVLSFEMIDDLLRDPKNRQS